MFSILNDSLTVASRGQIGHYANRMPACETHELDQAQCASTKAPELATAGDAVTRWKGFDA